MKGPKYVETNFQLLLSRRLEYNKHINQIKNAKCNPMLEKRVTYFYLISLYHNNSPFLDSWSRIGSRLI